MLRTYVKRSIKIIPFLGKLIIDSSITLDEFKGCFFRTIKVFGKVECSEEIKQFLSVRE